jgi:hypothetical protein
MSYKLIPKKKWELPMHRLHKLCVVHRLCEARVQVSVVARPPVACFATAGDMSHCMIRNRLMLVHLIVREHHGLQAGQPLIHGDDVVHSRCGRCRCGRCR